MTELQEYRKANHLCTRCGKPAKVKWNGKILTMCEKCLKYSVYRTRKHRMKIVEEKSEYEVPCRVCHVLIYPEYVYCPWCGVKLEDNQ